MKLSIIVPVYNVEDYLPRCIDSLINQTLTDIEIILINDGSTDCSLDICNAYEKKDSRIHVINQINKGVSSARNTGINNATGDYLFFVDSDDWLEGHACEEIYTLIQSTKSDMCLFDFYSIINNQKTYVENAVKIPLLHKNEILEQVLYPIISPLNIAEWHHIHVSRTVWAYVYSRKFVLDYNLYFLEYMKAGEDLLYNIDALAVCNTLCYCHKPLYNYFHRQTSKLNTYKSNAAELEKIYCDEVLRHCQKHHLDQVLSKRLDFHIILSAMSLVFNEFQSNNPNHFYHRYINVKHIISNPNLSSPMKDLDLKGALLRDKLILTFMKYKQAFAICMYYTLRNLIKRLIRH